MGLHAVFRSSTNASGLTRPSSFKYWLLVINAVSTFQATDPETVVFFHGIRVHRLLSEAELDDLRARGTGNRAPFVPAGTPTPPSSQWPPQTSPSHPSSVLLRHLFLVSFFKFTFFLAFLCLFFLCFLWVLVPSLVHFFFLFSLQRVLLKVPFPLYPLHRIPPAVHLWNSIPNYCCPTI